MDLLLITVIAVIALALIFDFTNGFHDAANSVATVVATRALPARWAPAFSAFFNFAAYFIVGTAVANTIAKTVKSEYGGAALIFAALFAAIARAIEIYRHRDLWQRIQLRGMHTDFSWERSARQYVDLYRRAIASQLARPDLASYRAKNLAEDALGTSVSEQAPSLGVSSALEASS